MGAAVSLLSYTIPAIKYTIISLILLNIHSFPLTWHIRHWWVSIEYPNLAPTATIIPRPLGNGQI